MISPRAKETLIGYLFFSPWLIGFLLFGIYPIGMSMYYSLCRYDVLRVPQYIGADNYETIAHDPYVGIAIHNTLIFMAQRVPLVIIGSLLLALLANQTVKGIRVFRTIFFLPSIVTGVVLSVIFLWMLNPQIGLVNTALGWINIEGPLWLQSTTWSKPGLASMGLWSIGGARMIVFIAALQGIPTQLYEAVELDGGGTWRKFTSVTVPMLTPVIFLWTVLEVIFSFQVFTEAYVMTKGGPLNSTLFYNLYLYFKAFEDFQMGYASALAWVLLCITLVFTLLQFWIARKWVYYAGE